MKSQFYRFRVEQCDRSQAGNTCASDAETRDFVSDIQLDTWIAYEKMDFLDYEGKPTFLVQEVVSSTLLDYDSTIIPQDYLSMR